MRGRRLAALLAASLAAASGCAPAGSRLPEYGRPQGEAIEPDAYDSRDVIRYRALAREDFRASVMLERMAPHADGLGAYTYAYVVPDGAARVRIERSAAGGPYVARADVTYLAEMDRSRSWWNTTQRQLDEAYVLEHEQIHFALAEIHARRLSERIRALHARGASPQAAADALQGRIDAEVARTLEELREESTVFDEQTSFRHDPERQARWRADVERRLAGGP